MGSQGANHSEEHQHRFRKKEKHLEKNLQLKEFDRKKSVHSAIKELIECVV